MLQMTNISDPSTIILFRPAEEEEPVLVLENGPLFTPETIEILKEQLQMHLQLLVQHCVLAEGIDSLKSNYDVSLRRIVCLLIFCHVQYMVTRATLLRGNT